MGVLERVNAAHAEQRAIGGVSWRPWDDPYARFDVGGPAHPSRAGTGGIDGALRLQPVYSAVKLLAEGVAQLPLQQYRDLGGRKARVAPGQLLSRPSAYLNLFDWLFQYVSAAALTGTAVGLKTARDGYGYPTTIEWLPPDRVTITDSEPYNPARARFYFAGRQLDPADLLIVRAFTVPGRTAGVSPIRYFQLLIESGIDALAYGSGWYKSGGFPPGTFQNSQYEIETDQADEIKRRLVQAMRRREPLVYGRDWEYKPVSVPPSEAQFIDALQLNATQIAAVYGVPAHRIGGGRSGGGDITYSNAEAEQIGFVQDSLDPWLVRLETALGENLPQAQYVKFNRDARIRTDTMTRWNVYRAARDIGGMNVDEIRALEDMEPVPEPKNADDYDGADYTPLQIQVAAARGIKEILGEGAGGAAETNPQFAKKAAPQPGQGSQAPPGQAAQVPQPVPAANGKPRRG